MIHASLFSGIGGPEVAAAMLGWDNAFHCEINPFGKAILEYWFPNSESYDDITKASFTKWRGRIDVLTGGFPCQPFSYAGKRGGADDNRYLWPQMLRVIDEVRPAWVVGENVAGITTMVEGGILADMGCDPVMFGEGDGLHRYQLRERFTIERICSDLEGLGYAVQPMLIPAAAVGAPHRRDRVFILAHDADADRRDDMRVAGIVSRSRGTAGVQELDA
uniref:DNA cytosine methyltransferase n=1 Tax=Succinimonas sp. TaxID=1936151 RepID=UPI00386C3033